MALVVGTNSWATVAEADSYLEDKINTEQWFALNDESTPSGSVSKSTLLTSAFWWLMGAPQLSLSASLSSDDVKHAQIEAAFFLFEHYDALNERRAAIFTGVENFDLSRRSERFKIDQLKIPDHIMGILSSYGVENTTAQLLGQYDV